MDLRSKGQGFLIVVLHIVSMRISNLSVKPLKFPILSNSSDMGPFLSIPCPQKFRPLSSHLTFFCRCSLHCSCLLAPARSIESVHEDIGMLQTPVFSCVRGDLVWVGSGVLCADVECKSFFIVQLCVSITSSLTFCDVYFAVKHGSCHFLFICSR
jgi:hypothetical protein